MSTPPRIYRLIGIPDYKKTIGRQKLHQIHLNTRRILEFVNQYMRPSTVQHISDLRVLNQQFTCHENQIVKIERIVGEKSIAIVPIHLASILEDGRWSVFLVIMKWVTTTGIHVLHSTHPRKNIDWSNIQRRLFQINLFFGQILVDDSQLFRLINNNKRTIQYWHVGTPHHIPLNRW